MKQVAFPLYFFLSLVIVIKWCFFRKIKFSFKTSWVFGHNYIAALSSIYNFSLQVFINTKIAFLLKKKN